MTKKKKKKRKKKKRKRAGFSSEGESKSGFILAMKGAISHQRTPNCGQAEGCFDFRKWNMSAFKDFFPDTLRPKHKRKKG